MSEQQGLPIPRTPIEDALLLRAFATDERGQRQSMIFRHPERGAYWRARVVAADAAIDAAERLLAFLGAKDKGG